MNDRSAKFPFNPLILVLGFIGAVLLGIGAADHFVGTGLVPESLRVEGYTYAMMIVGGLFLMIESAHVVTAARRSKEHSD